MEGLPVKGTRHTATWPAGSMGRDQPVTVVTETWVSPDLRVTVLNTGNDPRTGNFTRKLTHVIRAEPDPSLFRPPASYTVVDDDMAALRAASRPIPSAGTILAGPPQPETPPEHAVQPARAAQAQHVAQPEPAPTIILDDAPDESSFDDAPPADAPVDPSAYVGVNVGYIGVNGAKPPASEASASTAAATAPARPKPPNPKIPKTPSPEKPVQ
jgi:hypothetical protein